MDSRVDLPLLGLARLNKPCKGLFSCGDGGEILRLIPRVGTRFGFLEEIPKTTDRRWQKLAKLVLAVRPELNRSP